MSGDGHEHGHTHARDDAPGHGHAHDDAGHAHDDAGHAHGHAHAPGGAPPPDPEARREPLPAGAGRGKLLFLDAFSGIAGDMTVAALVDLGVPSSVVQDAVHAVGLDDVTVAVGGAWAGAIGAARFEVRATGTQPQRTYRTIDAMLADASLADGVQQRARRIFQVLAEAEAEVHRVAVEDVHFHEVGAVDSIVDVVGAAACLEHLGAEIVVTPLPMGRGRVDTQHGPLPLPPPATVSCLRGVPTHDAGIDGELVTPTGAAIVAASASRFERWPTFAPERIGWGAGSRTLPDRPNALRVVLGPSMGAERADAGFVLLEANIDDMTGELAAHAIDALLAAGALDAWATPVTMKKGRPGLTIAALSASGAADRVAHAMLRETTTIGVRRVAATRTERPRRGIEVETPFGRIRVKVSEGAFGPAQVKPEFDDCARAAREHDVPVREVLAAALGAARANQSGRSSS